MGPQWALNGLSGCVKKCGETNQLWGGNHHDISELCALLMLHLGGMPVYAVSISIRGIRGIPHFQKHPNNWDDWNEGVNVRVNHSNWCESELKPAGMNFTPGLGFQDMYGFYIFL